MKRVMITGSSGFIGRRAVGEMARLGYEVHAVARSSGLASEGVFIHEADLLDPHETEHLVKLIRPTHLLHLAWYAEHGKFWSSPLNLDWVAASLRLLRAFVEVGGTRAVMAGSCAEYDWSYAHLSEQTTPSRPRTLYGVSKNALREVAQKFAEQSKISLAWARIFFLYGPGEAPQRFVAGVYAALQNRQPAVVQCGGHVRDFLHVDDVARAFAEIADSTLEGIVNIASAQPVTLGRIAEILGELTGASDLLEIQQSPGSPDNPPILTADAGRLASIGFTPRYSLRDGLATLIA